MPKDKPRAAWSDRTSRFPDDVRLREAGWRIVARPARGPAIWGHPAGIEMTEAEAVTTLAKRAEFATYKPTKQ
jgi:hypothetical protein